MKILRVGDPHVRPSNLEESERLMGFILGLALDEKVDRLEILGDLFHTHAILRLEVIDFWMKWLDTFSKSVPEVVVLVGNHDQSGDHKANQHALNVFSKIPWNNVFIIDTIGKMGVIGYMAFVHSKDEFVKRADQLHAMGCKVLVCHATFDGSKYESGIYAPDGMPMLPHFIHVISGHIHSLQEFFNVIYPGTARWDSISDANHAKGIWIYEHDDDGRINKRDFYTTERVCSPIFSYTWNEGEEAPTIPPGSRSSVKAIGSSDFCNKAKAHFKGQAQFSSKILDQARRENRQTGRSLKEFLIDYYPVAPERRLKLLKFMEEENLV